MIPVRTLRALVNNSAFTVVLNRMRFMPRVCHARQDHRVECFTGPGLGAGEKRDLLPDLVTEFGGQSLDVGDGLEHNPIGAVLGA